MIKATMLYGASIKILEKETRNQTFLSDVFHPTYKVRLLGESSRGVQYE